MTSLVEPRFYVATANRGSW